MVAMLAATIENARRAPFFADRLGTVDANELAENFAEIGPITKQQIWQAGDLARVDLGEWRQYYTGGTTGVAFPYQVSQLEETQFQAIYKTALAKIPSIRAARLWDGGQIHGRTIPTPVRFHEFSVYSPGAFQHLCATLSSRFDDPGLPDRCTLLSGGERVLKAFACWLAERKPDPQWQLNAVLAYGACLTTTTRQLLTSAFGAPLIDRYGVSEAIGGATECSCGWYHPDPCLYVEAVSPYGLASVKEGIGRLLLTPFFPFQQRQPLIRYDPGDLALVTETESCRPNELAIRPLGRLANSLCTPDGVYLTEFDILEVLDQVPGTRRRKTLRDCEAVSEAWPVGAPLFVASNRNGEAHIQVYMRWLTSDCGLSVQIEQKLAERAILRTGKAVPIRVTLTTRTPRARRAQAG